MTTAERDAAELPTGYTRDRITSQSYNTSALYGADDLYEFVPTYSRALLEAEKEFQAGNDPEDVWEVYGDGRGAPLCVKEDVSMDTVYNLFERQIEQEINPSYLDIVERGIDERPLATVKVLGGTAGAAIGGAVAAGQGDLTAIDAVNNVLEPAVTMFEPFASETAAGAMGAFLDGTREFVMEFDPQEYAEELKDCTLDHFYLIDVEYHRPDLGEIEDIVAESGPEALDSKGIMSESQWDMISKQREDDIDEPVRLLYVVWDPTDERTMVQHILRERFDDFGDPQAVYNRNLC